VSFTVPASNGGSAILYYTVTSSPGNFTASGGTARSIITGLTDGTALYLYRNSNQCRRHGAGVVPFNRCYSPDCGSRPGGSSRLRCSALH